MILAKMRNIGEGTLSFCQYTLSGECLGEKLSLSSFKRIAVPVLGAIAKSTTLAMFPNEMQEMSFFEPI